MDVMTLAAKLTLNTSEFDANLSSSEKEMKGMTSGGVAWGNIISQAVTKAAKATINFGKDVIKVGADFDTAMSQVKALGQLENDDFIRVRKRAMELGESTKFTASQVAEAFSYMALAGWDTDEMLAGIDGVLNLAAASGEDLGRTSDIVTDAITAMGLTAKDSSHFVDVLAQASANSNTTVAQMGEAFKFLATTGGVLEYSIDDVATTLGLLANNGIKASQAGTSMRQILNTLINPSKKAGEAMEKLGISLFDPETNARKPLGQVLREFRDVFKDAGLQLEEGFDPAEIQERLDKLNAWYDEEYAKIQAQYGDKNKKAYKDLDEEYEARFAEEITPNQNFLANLGDIGGLRGISALFAIMNSTDEDFEQLTKAINDSEGAADEMAKTMLDNLEGDITILNSAMEGLKIIVSDSFKEQLRSFVQTLTEQIGNLNQAFQENGVLGMFVNLADWVINGLVDQLSNPNEEQVQSFGKAIGEFIGTVAARLVTSLPDLLAGIVTIGESLAGGLIEGLFKGLFGDKSEVTNLVDGLNKELSGIEVNNVKAQGLLNYLEDLVKAGDENVTKTDAWKTAVEQLEEIMPGVKSILEEEGSTLEENIGKVRTMTDEFRKQAIQQAFVNTLQKEYETLAEQGVRREQEKVNIGIQQGTQRSVLNTYQEQIGKYAQLVQGLMAQGVIEDNGQTGEYIGNLLQGKVWAGDRYANLSEMDASSLQSILSGLIGTSRAGGNIWDTDQSFMSLDEINKLKSQYDEAASSIEQSNKTITGINAEMEATKQSISTAEQAVQTLSSELGLTATGVNTSGDAVVSALSGLASRIDGMSVGGESDGSNAKGLWDVPYDDYVSTLHRGEMVLNATRAREYREGGTNTSLDLDGLVAALEAAIKAGMEGATVRSYLNGRDITDEVNRTQIKQLKARRYAT